MAARVQVIHEARLPGDKEREKDQWTLAFQWCLYVYDDGTSENGYRFIWRRPGGNLQAARGQARIPSIQHAEALMQVAKDEGWGDLEG